MLVGGVAVLVGMTAVLVGRCRVLATFVVSSMIVMMRCLPMMMSGGFMMSRSVVVMFA